MKKDYKAYKETFGMMDIFLILTEVIASQVYSSVIIYVYFIYKFISFKLFKKKTNSKLLNEV
jgi:hypothetical protein